MLVLLPLPRHSIFHLAYRKLKVLSCLKNFSNSATVTFLCLYAVVAKIVVRHYALKLNSLLCHQCFHEMIMELDYEYQCNP